ncbi:MAG: hypothetical protein AB7D06_14960 [Pedobacter sp.]
MVVPTSTSATVDYRTPKERREFTHKLALPEPVLDKGGVRTTIFRQVSDKVEVKTTTTGLVKSRGGSADFHFAGFLELEVFPPN